MNGIILCKDIKKDFTLGKETVHALNGISLSIHKGRIVGLLGPDGAGKTTLLRILAGLLIPDEGNASVLGYDCVRNAENIQSVIGYMPQKFGLYENLTLHENMKLYAELHQIPLQNQKPRFDELLEMMNLSRFPNRRAGKLSGGMKQKLALACALISDPDILLLDEPTVGVDIISRRELFGILRKIVDERKSTVFVSTSYMDEADYCDEIVVLYQGQIIASGAKDSLIEKAKTVKPNPTLDEGFQMLIAGAIPLPLKRKAPLSPDAEIVVKATNLVKKFGTFTAVDHTNFEVRRGEVFGLLGANGAGKTTTFRMMCGLDAVTSGNVEICGINLHTASGKARQKIGFVAQKFSLYADLTVIENLEFFGAAYGLSRAKRKDRIHWAIHEFALANYQNAPTGDLPLGIKQRLSMACALLHEPEILFLDEATSGADPLTRYDFWRRILDLADKGVAVIITTHFMDEADYCDHMVIMQDGKTVASGSVTEIRRQGTPEGAPLNDITEAFVHIIQKKETAS